MCQGYLRAVAPAPCTPAVNCLVCAVPQCTRPCSSQKFCSISPSLSWCLCLSFFVCLSACLYLCLSLSLSLSLSLCLCLCLSLSPSLSLSQESSASVTSPALLPTAVVKLSLLALSSEPDTLCCNNPLGRRMRRLSGKPPPWEGISGPLDYRGALPPPLREGSGALEKAETVFRLRTQPRPTASRGPGSPAHMLPSCVTPTSCFLPPLLRKRPSLGLSLSKRTGRWGRVQVANASAS